mgnify:CR=1 FL=1
MNSLDLEDIVYNDFFKDYDKNEIYKIVNQLNTYTYRNENDFNKTLRTIIRGQKKNARKSYFIYVLSRTKKSGKD